MEPTKDQDEIKPNNTELDETSMPQAEATSNVENMETQGVNNVQKPSGKKFLGMSKKLAIIVGIVVGLVAILLALGGFSIGIISKADYRKAYDLQKEMTDTYNSARDLTTSISTSSAKEDNTELVDSMKKKFDELKQKIEKVGSSKAVKYNIQLKDAYKELNDKMPKFEEAFLTSVEVIEKIYPAVSAYSSTSTTDTYEVRINTASEAFSSVEGLKYDVNKDFVKAAIAAYEEALPYAKKIDAYKVDFKKYESGVSTKYFDAISKYTDALKDWGNKVKDIASQAEIKNEINNLTELIYQKAS